MGDVEGEVGEVGEIGEVREVGGWVRELGADITNIPEFILGFRVFEVLVKAFDSSVSS